jgi:hypothetical protein
MSDAPAQIEKSILAIKSMLLLLRPAQCGRALIYLTFSLSFSGTRS